MPPSRVWKEEVCELIGSTVGPNNPTHCCKEPDMVLTDGEVRFWMRQHRRVFEIEETMLFSEHAK
eukprot:11212009-Lingulodinium_polyedra.AAC.1